MKVIIFDSHTQRHDIKVPIELGVPVKSVQEAKSAFAQDTHVMLIHTSEADDVRGLIQWVIREHPSIPVVLYSGGGAAEPQRIAAEFNTAQHQCVWAFDDRETARRFHRVGTGDDFEIGPLLEQDRRSVALDVLGILYGVQLRLEHRLKCKSEETIAETEEAEVIRAFERIAGQGHPFPVNPWKRSAYLTPYSIRQELVQKTREAADSMLEIYQQRLKDIRESLLAWANAEAK